MMVKVNKQSTRRPFPVAGMVDEEGRGTGVEVRRRWGGMAPAVDFVTSWWLSFYASAGWWC